MWIFACGMIRSGSTLQFQIASELIERTQAGRVYGWMHGTQFLEILAKEPDPAGLGLVKVHGYIPEAGELINSGRAKAIYTYRDVRDVVVSVMNKDKCSFAEIGNAERIRKIVANDRKWRAVRSILIASYEAITGDLPGEIRRVAKHLELPCSDELVAELSDKLSLSSQKKRIASFDYSGSGIERDGKVLAPDSLLHSNHINSGESRQWRSKLTGFQIARLEAWSGSWLRENGFAFKYSAVARKALACGSGVRQFLAALPRRAAKVLAHPSEILRLWSRPRQ